MRYFKLEREHAEHGKVSNIHAIEGNISDFVEAAKQEFDRVVELEEKQVY